MFGAYITVLRFTYTVNDEVTGQIVQMQNIETNATKQYPSCKIGNSVWWLQFLILVSSILHPTTEKVQLFIQSWSAYENGTGIGFILIPDDLYSVQIVPTEHFRHLNQHKSA